MSVFPYIKWWQSNKQIFIEFLHESINFTANKENNMLIFKDNIYNIELDLLNDFNIDNILNNPKTTKLILNKVEESKWTKLLKNEKKYKYYISIDWDKFLDDELEEDTNPDMNNMMQGIDPSMFNPDQFKDLMSNMNMESNENSEVENKDDSEENQDDSEENQDDSEENQDDSEENQDDSEENQENIENTISNLDK